MRIFYVCSAACLALTAALFADGQPPSQPDILDRVMKKTSVREKSLPELATLMTEASGVAVKLAPEIQKCIADKKPGCDWKISTDWDAGPLSAALDTLTASRLLGYRVTGNQTVLITRPAAPKP